MISQDPDCIRCDDAAEGAALGLLGLMTGISEECWCAGWMEGLEFSLWGASGGMRYGQGIITERESQLLKLLSEECDGWWRWADGPLFISTADWLRLLEPKPEGASEALRDGEAGSTT
jgi:hypothetical protein